MRQVLILCIGCILGACTTRPVTPSRDSRRAIDTIYQKQVLTSLPHMDSLCAHISDSLYTAALDSILTLRRTEMNALVK